MTRVLIFARAPIAGRCKTRLIPRLGAGGAARVHRLLAERALRTALASGATVELWCAPDTSHGQFLAWRRRYGVRLRRQSGGDLGQRMSAAVNHALRRGIGRVLVIGTDCPDLQAEDLRAALAALERVDTVLQPAADGGYVLIGARRLPARALHGIAWSSGHELAQTRARLRRLGLALAEMPQRRDVDTPADYRRSRREGLLKPL